MQVQAKSDLSSLIPIAVVVVGGCEPCAEKMVAQALARGCSWQEVDETLRILTDMQKRQCVLQALGAEVAGRMEKPLAAGRRTLEQARSKAASACGCGGEVTPLSASARR
jgi:hypothetical protein